MWEEGKRIAWASDYNAGSNTSMAAATLSSLVNLSHVLVLNAGTVLFRRFLMTSRVEVEDFLETSM